MPKIQVKIGWRQKRAVIVLINRTSKIFVSVACAIGHSMRFVIREAIQPRQVITKSTIECESGKPTDLRSLTIRNVSDLITKIDRVSVAEAV